MWTFAALNDQASRTPTTCFCKFIAPTAVLPLQFAEALQCIECNRPLYIEEQNLRTFVDICKFMTEQTTTRTGHIACLVSSGNNCSSIACVLQPYMLRFLDMWSQTFLQLV